MADTKEPLLLSKDVSENEIDNKNKNKYECDEKCSGCQIERRKAEDPNIPWSNFVFIWVITLTSGKISFHLRSKFNILLDVHLKL